MLCSAKYDHNAIHDINDNDADHYTSDTNDNDTNDTNDYNVVLRR